MHPTNQAKYNKRGAGHFFLREGGHASSPCSLFVVICSWMIRSVESTLVYEGYCFAECIAWIDECVRVCVAVKCEGGKGGL